KIVCDACQAKYSISDDKVQGKVFKIRCKKCSNIIVVRGGAGAAEAAPAAQEKDTRVYDYGADAGASGGGGDESVWHVVINQDQVGPMTAAEVQQRFAAGEIDAETYAWREGFADWLPLSQVDAFAAYVASGSTTAAVSNGDGGGSGAAAVSAMFGGGEDGGTVRSDPGDLFSAASASSASSGGDEDGDLFGRSRRQTASGSAKDAANSKLRGERNENSVLFSLNNLAQLASDKPAPSASVVSTPSGHATGAAGGEGSGLIDIRSMANAYLGNSGGGTAKPAASIGSMDDLPVFGGGGFSEPAVIVPTAGRQQNNKMMYVLIGSVGFLAVAAVIMIVVMLKGGKDDGKGDGNQVAANDKGSGEEGKTPDGKPPETASATENKTPDTGSATENKTPETGSATENKTPEPETKEPEKKPDAKKPDTKRPDPKRPGGTTVAAKTPEKKPDPPPAKEPAGGGGCDEVSCVLNNYEGACCAKFKKGPKAPAGGTTAAKPAGGGGDLPDSLDRQMIQDGVNKVKTRVMGCGDKSSAKGQVKVSVKVSPSGSVSNVAVKSSPDAALGSCVASAMQKATFGKTQNGGSFAYPWNF
ncbi:MAG: zinc-ribbon domain-containing protein, partial [Deltaproteobacteria bacterium]|nr:zinc-ribbon domain-containing protein [Deltaproteobacteria bacterium]